MVRGSSSRSQESHGSSEIVKENESVYQLYKPAGTPSIQVVFFHGLQPGPYSDAHLSTWKSEDDSCIWPQTWLVEEIPEAQVFSVSCSGVLRNSSNASIDMYNLAENLISDLLMANIGQVPNCPLVLVGHSIGGLVIKELCCQAHRQLSMNKDFQRTKLEKFLTNLRGVFYFATPHHGSPVANDVADMVGIPLMKYFKTLSTEAARLNSTFDGIRKVYEKWQFASLGEGSPTDLGWLGKRMVVPEASVREDNFNVVQGADHFSICRPGSKQSRSFHKLKEFLVHIANEVKDEGWPENLQRLPEHITGIDGQVEQVEAMLKDNRTLGLVGMGGLGKTTLAKATFNKLCVCFEYTCFVEDVKHIAGTADTVKAQVLSNLYRWGKKVEMHSWYTLRGGQIFLVLDDISGARDEEVLLYMVDLTSPKSRFIATSREQDSLQRLNFIYEVQLFIYEVQLLNENSAESLFKSHAFPDQILPVDLVDLTKAIVRKSEGLPLTLEVLGQYLKTTEDVEDWEQVVHSLDKAEAVSSINERLWEKLRPSYNALGEEEKQMFFEAATIFHGGSVYCHHSMGFSLREVKAAWREAYGASERLMWKTLVERSLVYDVGEDDCIQIHEQLRSLGRKVAKEAYKDGLCRVWEMTTMSQTLQITDDMDENSMDVHALRLQKEGRSISIAGPALRKLKNVRFLVTGDNIEIEGLEANGSFLSKLVLLKCIGTQLFKLAIMNCLVVLYLVDNTIKVLPDSIGQLSALRFFHLSAGQIEMLPDGIGNLSQLEVLHLYNCDHLKSLPKTFGELMRLKCLGFHRCKNLLALPDSFGNLRALEHLEFSNWTGLLSLPKSFGCLTALKELVFRQCFQLHALPESFGHLSVLNHLEFNWCYKLQSLPESFGHLSALNHLEFNRCRELQSLPESFGHLSALNHLEFDDCSKLQSLPESFGQLSALKYLRFKSCVKLQSLPESFEHLSALNRLEFYQCMELQSLPESFGHLSALNHLVFNGCSELQSLPKSFGDLSELNHLEFHDCDKLQSLPESFGHLYALNHLEFNDCGKLQSLPESFGHLSALNHLEFYNCNKLQSLPESFGQLSALKYLRFKSCFKLQSLPESFEHLSALNRLEFHDCGKFQSLSESFRHLSALNHLEFNGCMELQSLPESFGHLSALSRLEFNRCMELQSLPESFGHLSALNHLEFCNCNKLQSLPESFGHLSALNHLEFNGCMELQSLPESFGHLSALNHLVFNGCSELQSLPKSFGDLSELNHLEFHDCDKLQSLPESFGHLYALNHLEFNDCGKLQSLPESFGHLSALNHLEFNRCMELQSLPESFGHLSAVKYVRFKNCVKLKSLPESFGHRHQALDLAMWEDCMGKVNHRSESGHFFNEISVLTVTDEDDESLGMVETQQSHLTNDKVREAQMVQDFIADVDDSSECGYFVSKAWLLGLDEHESEKVMSVLRRNRYLEIFDTETTVWYERMEELLTLRDDPFPTPEEKNSSCEDTSQTRASVESGPALDKIQHIGFNTTKHDGDTIEAKNDQTGASLLQTDEKLKGTQLESGEASITTNDKLLSSLRKALKDSVRHSYSIRTRWLSSLSSSEMKELNSTLVEAGYSQTYQTSTITHFERIRAHVLCPSTNDGETTSTSQNGSIVSGVESTSGFQGTGESLHLQGLKLAEKGSSSVKVESTTSSKTNARCVCTPEILTVSFPQGPSEASSSNGNCDSDSIRQKVGDCYVTTPLERAGRDISTSVDKDVSITTVSTDERGCLIQETVDFNVSAGTLVSCCLRRDLDDKKVNIDFHEVTGNINLVDPNRSYGMVLKSVRANVYACVRHSKKIPIRLELKKDESDTSWPRVLKSHQPFYENGQRNNSIDLIWLALSGKSPKNSPKPSKTLELGCNVPCRLLVDISTCDNNAIELSFVDIPSVIFEGDVYTDSEQNPRLELNLRYQVEISHLEHKFPLPPADKICHPGKRVIKVVDFDCFLELRTDVLRQD
ncbi:unnamed protein product [Calypogeia fissa]